MDKIIMGKKKKKASIEKKDDDEKDVSIRIARAIEAVLKSRLMGVSIDDMASGSSSGSTTSSSSNALELIFEASVAIQKEWPNVARG